MTAKNSKPDNADHDQNFEFQIDDIVRLQNIRGDVINCNGLLGKIVEINEGKFKILYHQVNESDVQSKQDEANQTIWVTKKQMMRIMKNVPVYTE